MVTGVINILIEDSNIQSLVGMNEADEKYKVYPVIASQKEKSPYIVVRQVSGSRPAKNCGFQGSFNVVCYSKSFDETNEISEAIIEALDGKKGGSVGTMTLSNVADDWTQAEGDGLYAKILTFDCNYESGT